MNALIAPNANLLVAGYVYDDFVLDLYGDYTEFGVDIEGVALAGQKFDIAGLLGPLVIEKLNYDAEPAVLRAIKDENDEGRISLAMAYTSMQRFNRVGDFA